jgi:hypothetical protein
VITRTWHAEDACGNQASCSQRITIADETPLSIVWPSDVSVPRRFVDDLKRVGQPIVTATPDSSYTVRHLDIPKPRGTCPDSIYRLWSVRDECGHGGSRGQTITILTDENAPPFVPKDSSASRDPSTYRVTVSWTAGDPDGDPVRYRVYTWSSNPSAARLAGQITTDEETAELVLSTSGFASYMRWRIEASDGCLQVESEEFLTVLSPVVVRRMSLVAGDTPWGTGPSLCHDGQGQVEFELSGGLPPYVWTLYQDGYEYLSGSELSPGDAVVPIDSPGEYVVSVTDSAGGVATKLLEIKPEVNGCGPYPPTQLATGINAGDPAFVSFWWEGGEPGGGVVNYEFTIVEIDSIGEPTSDPEQLITWQGGHGTVRLGALFLNHGSTYEWHVTATTENGLSASSLDVPPYKPATLEIEAANPGVSVELSMDFATVSPATASPLNLEVSNTGNCTASFEIEIRALQGDRDESIATVKTEDLRPGQAWQTTVAPLLPSWLQPGDSVVLRAEPRLSTESRQTLGDVVLLGLPQEPAEAVVHVDSLPIVTLLSPTNGKQNVATTGAELRWEAYDPDGDEMRFVVELSSDEAAEVARIEVPKGQQSYEIPRLEAGVWHTWTVHAYTGPEEPPAVYHDPAYPQPVWQPTKGSSDPWTFRTQEVDAVSLSDYLGSVPGASVYDLYKEHYVFSTLSAGQEAYYSTALGIMWLGNLDKLIMDTVTKGIHHIIVSVVLAYTHLEALGPLADAISASDFNHWYEVERPAVLRDSERLQILLEELQGLEKTPLDLPGRLFSFYPQLLGVYDPASRIIISLDEWAWHPSSSGSFDETKPLDYDEYVDPHNLTAPAPSATSHLWPGTLVWEYLYNRFPEIAAFADGFYASSPPVPDASASSLAFRSELGMKKAEEGAAVVDQEIQGLISIVGSAFGPNANLGSVRVASEQVLAGDECLVTVQVNNLSVTASEYFIHIQARAQNGEVVWTETKSLTGLGPRGASQDVEMHVGFGTSDVGRHSLDVTLWPSQRDRDAGSNRLDYVPLEDCIEVIGSTAPVECTGQKMQDPSGPGEEGILKLRLKNPASFSQDAAIELTWSNDRDRDPADTRLELLSVTLPPGSEAWYGIPFEAPSSVIPGETYYVLAVVGSQDTQPDGQTVRSVRVDIPPQPLRLVCDDESSRGGGAITLPANWWYEITWLLPDEYSSCGDNPFVEIMLYPGPTGSNHLVYAGDLCDLCEPDLCAWVLGYRYLPRGEYLAGLELWDSENKREILASYSWRLIAR